MEQVTVNEVINAQLPIYIASGDEFVADTHPMFRLIIVKAGTGILHMNGQSVVFMAPTLFCINERDAIRLEKGCNLEVVTIYFNPSIVNDILTIEKIRGEDKDLNVTSYQDYFYLSPFIKRSQNFIGKFDMGIAMEKRMTQLLQLLHKEITTLENKFWPCRTRSFFLEILFLIQYVYTESSEESTIQLPNASPDLNDIILYLHTHYEKKITIEQLKNRFHINRTTLAKKFYDGTGISIMEYLIKLRIKVGAMMLRDTFLPISEIMYRVGFNESTHFGRMFKKHIGCSPSEYRKQNNSV